MYIFSFLFAFWYIFPSTRIILDEFTVNYYVVTFHVTLGYL